MSHDLEREGDTNQLRFLPSLPVLLHQQIADWLHKVLENKEKKFHVKLFKVKLDFEVFTRLVIVWGFLLDYNLMKIFSSVPQDSIVIQKQLKNA